MQENKPIGPPKKYKRNRAKFGELPEVGKDIFRYVQEERIPIKDIESLIGVSRSMLYKMQKTKFWYVQTIYQASVGLKRDFFAPIIKQLYEAVPELRKANPKHQKVEELEKENLILKKENADLKHLCETQKELIGMLRK